MDITNLVEKINEKYQIEKSRITIDLVKQEESLFKKEIMRAKNPTTYFYLAAAKIIKDYKIEKYIKNNIDKGEEIIQYFKGEKK